jgi:hypothetical protein
MGSINLVRKQKLQICNQMINPRSTYVPMQHNNIHYDYENDSFTQQQLQQTTYRVTIHTYSTLYIKLKHYTNTTTTTHDNIQHEAIASMITCNIQP